MTNRKVVMTVSQLLAWAYQETQIAEGLERLLPDMPEEVQAAMKEQVQAHRDRSRWLDMQVEYWLEKADEERAKRE